MLYEVPRDAVLRSALLRAEAAAIRDTQSANPEWPTIRRLLEESYVSLHEGVGESGS